MLNWSDERYVRLYTRDTPDWLCLSFLAQGLFCLVLRKVDRAGVLELGRAGKKGVAIAIGQAHEWPKLEAAFEELLADGCVTLQGDRLCIPNFVEAQEAEASDRARSRAYRERRRDLARSGVTYPDNQPGTVTVEPQNVTPRHAPTTPRDGPDTPRDATVTNCDATVTPSRTVPSRTVPNQPNQTSVLANGTDRGSAPPASPPANGMDGEAEKPLLVVDMTEIPDEEAATAKAQLEQRLKQGYGTVYTKALAVSSKLLRAETVQAWTDAVRRFGREAVVDACYDAAGDYWRRKGHEPVESLRFFLDTLKRLRPAKATP